MAANMLRIIRGGGKPDQLLEQMEQVLQLASKLEKATNLPPSGPLTDALHSPKGIWESYVSGEIDERVFNRWQRDGTIAERSAQDKIRGGVLQILASQLLRQQRHLLAGHRELEEGIEHLMSVRSRSSETRILSAEDQRRRID
jgi:hypothetical protein